MDKVKVWKHFLEELLDSNIEEHNKTKEYEYFYNRFLNIDEMLTTNLTSTEKTMVEEVIVELGIAQEHETLRMYEQGMKDCVIILKNIGVI